MQIQSLRKWDTISVICPSAWISVLPKSVIDRAYDFFRNKGLCVREMHSCRLNTWYTAWTVEDRVNDIHQSFEDESIKMIMAFWGGRNTNQLLDSIDYEVIKKHPKRIIGYSDVTALLQAIYVKTGMITYYWPGMVNFIRDNICDYTWDYFERFFIDKPDTIAISSSLKIIDNDESPIPIASDGILIYREWSVSGKVIAWHLWTLLRLYGTPYFPDLTNAVLFIESSEDQKVGDVDRELTQMKLLWIFDKISGLIFGCFRRETGFQNNINFKDILDRVIPAQRNIPIAYNMNFWHTNPVCIIPNGGTCEIEMKKDVKKIVFTTY